MNTLNTSRFSWSRRLLPVAGAVTLALALGACGEKKQEQAQQGPPPPPEVGVMTVEPGTVRLTTELPGRLEASRVAEVRARAAGILLKRHFREGSDVRAGQALFTIDPAPYRATLNSAQATLAQAQANLAQASALANRYRPLVAANAVSKQEYDAAVAAEKAARAQVDAGRAAVDSARINLGYTNVNSPISGRIGRELVTEGALVGQGQPTHMATVQQINPLFVNVTQSAGEVVTLRQALQSGQLARTADGAVGVEVLLENGQPYDHTGRLLFTDLTVDPGTGQVSLRAEVPNPQALLLPGMYVRVRFQQAQVNQAVLVPQQAVTRGSQGDTVLVVAGDGSFAPRSITINQAQGTNWVVTSGLQAGDKVIVDGFTRLRPGVKQVTPVPVAPAAAASAAASGPAVASSTASAAPAATPPASAAAPMASAPPAAAASN